MAVQRTTVKSEKNKLTCCGQRLVERKHGHCLLL
jgi:hypothetical protein